MKNRHFRILFSPDTGDGGDGGGGSAPPPPPALLNPDLSFAEGYQEHVGEHAAGLNFKNLPDVFKSVKEGTATITRLNQERAELAKQLESLKGTPPVLPADSAGYLKEIAIPDKLPEGVEVPEGMLAAAAEFALANQIAPDVTSKFIQFQIEQAGKEFKSAADQQLAAVERAKAEIAAMVGPQNYDTAIANAQAAHDLLGLNLTPADLIQNTTLVTSLAKMHAKLEPGTLKSLGIGAEGASAEGKLSQANDILVNPQNPHHAAFYDQSHVGHRDAMNHYNRLILESAG